MTAKPHRHSPTPWWIDDDGCIAAGSRDSYVTIASVRYPACRSALPTMRANAEFIVRACNAHDRSVQALHQLTAAAFALDAAIDGVSDQFDDEIAALRRALKTAARVRHLLERSAP
jgi:hypothetical protein